MKPVIIIAIAFVLLIPNVVFAENIQIQSTCESGILILTITDQDGNILEHSTVMTIKELVRVSGYESKFISDENGSVKISYSENTGMVWIKKAGHVDLKTIVEKCTLSTNTIEPNTSNSNTKVIIMTNPYFDIPKNFPNYNHCENGGSPIGVIVEGEIQSNGELTLEVSNKGLEIAKETKLISENNPKALFCITVAVFGSPTTYTAINGDSKTSIDLDHFSSHTPEKNLEDEFRKLPSAEKEYTSSMNVLGKTIRIFDDKICVEEFCKYSDKLPVHVEGNIGLNTKNPIKIQIIFNGVIVGKIPAENRGGGDVHADWTIRKSTPEGIYGIMGIDGDREIVGGMGDTMMDVVNGNYNARLSILSNLENIDESNSPIQQVSKPKVPEWVKNNAKWWADGQVDDSTFTQGIGFLIKEKILGITDLPEQVSISDEKVPEWVKNNAKWWADGMISEDDFVMGIKYLVEKGIVRVQ